MTKLRIFGSIHFNSRDVVEDDFREFSRGADAIAIEEPRLGESIRSTAELVLRYPLFFVGLQLLALLQLPLYALFNRDLRSVEQIAVRAVTEERDEQPVYSVDRHPLAVLTERSPAWIVGNWLAFLPFAAAFPTTALVATALAVGLLVVATIRVGYGYRLPTLVAAALASALVYGLLIVDPILNQSFAVVATLCYLGAGIGLLKLTLEARNEAMLEDVAELTAEHGYGRICLVTGYGHVPGIVERASTRGLTAIDAFKPAWRASGQVLKPEAVLESPDDLESGDARFRTETAGTVLVRRALATVIDWVVITLLVFVGLVVLGGMDLAVSIGDETVVGLIVLCWLALAPPAYYVIGEARYGRTVGKSILGLAVVQIDGSPCTGRDALLRTALHPLDFLPVGYLLGALIAAVTDYGQRLGDLAAGTTVVKRTRRGEAPTDDAGATDGVRDTDEWSRSDDAPADEDTDETDDGSDPVPRVHRLESDESSGVLTADR